MALALPLAVSTANQSPASTAPTPLDCNSSFDPYAYTQAAVSACGYKTVPLEAVNTLSGEGGSTYDYILAGAKVRFYVPPVGFDPLTATDAELDKFAFPPRPTDPDALAHWEKEMSNWKGSAPPSTFLAETNSAADTRFSPNWAGYAVSGSSGQFTHAEAWYDEPSFGSSRCTTNEETTWAGIGGAFSGALGQAGTSHNVPGIGNHQAFWEVFPDVKMMAVNGLFGTPQSLFDASVRRISGGYRFFLHDYSTGVTAAFDSFIDDYSGNSAEAIAERPSTLENPNTYANLSNFGTLTFEQSQANGNGINTFDPNGGRHGVHMTSDGLSTGTDLADPSAIGAAGAFSVTQHSCN